MSSFTDRPILTPLHCGKKWVVRKEFVYEIGSIGSGDKIITPEGFITDLASTPRVIWSIFPPFGIYLSATIIHDYLYWEQIYSRKETDDIFLEGMKVLQVSKFDRKTIYNSVRLFAGGSWKSNQKRKESGEKKIIDLLDW
jgi:hypothetical protein